MTSRERVLAAIEHHEPDRVPVDYWGTPEVTQRLCEHFDTDEEGVLQKLHVDIRQVGPEYTGPELRTSPEGETADIWGVVRKKVPFGAGYYDEVTRYPLSGVREISELDSFAWPDPEWYDYDVIARECERHEGYAILNVGHRTNRTSVFKQSCYMRGMDQFMSDMPLDPELAKAIIRKITDYYLAHNERIFRASRGMIDIFMLGDDFGTQSGLLVSLPMWEEFFAPGLREFVQLAKSFDLKVMLHSCGSVHQLVPKIIELGVDVLNPIQTRAAGMDPQMLKDQFGDQIAFHGGIDIQHTLPNGTVEEVKAEVAQMTSILGKSGGYILAPTHNIQPDVPTENIFAMYGLPIGQGETS